MSVTVGVGSVEQPTHSAMFRALDPELPILAARAAMQLDCLIVRSQEGKEHPNVRLDAVRELAELVSHVGAETSHAHGVRSLMDPVTATVFSKAFSDTSSTSLRSYSELSDAARNLSGMFTRINEEGCESLSLLRDFCVRLSSYAASQRQSANRGRSPQPFRK